MLVSLLGMNPIAAFPIMMASCACLMPVGGLKFIRERKYDKRLAIGLAIGGIPGVFLAAFVVKSLPMQWLYWLVVIVVLYAAILMLRSALQPQPLWRKPMTRSARLDAPSVQALVTSVPGWALGADGKSISRRFRFQDSR